MFFFPRFQPIAIRPARLAKTVSKRGFFHARPPDFVPGCPEMGNRVPAARDDAKCRFEHD
jgi:hypothetical protein